MELVRKNNFSIFKSVKKNPLCCLFSISYEDGKKRKNASLHQMYHLIPHQLFPNTRKCIPDPFPFLVCYVLLLAPKALPPSDW
uniref:Uncharacterized protein n=1 Tax=Anguilla anguilla TaxID=7936 RepID=A0A0E9R5W2_ANGAN